MLHERHSRATSRHIRSALVTGRDCCGVEYSYTTACFAQHRHLHIPKHRRGVCSTLECLNTIVSLREHGLRSASRKRCSAQLAVDLLVSSWRRCRTRRCTLPHDARRVRLPPHERDSAHTLAAGSKRWRPENPPATTSMQHTPCPGTCRHIARPWDLRESRMHYRTEDVLRLRPDHYGGNHASVRAR